MNMQEVIKLGILEILELIENKQIKCEELAKAYLEQIAKLESKNAIVEVFEDALGKAKQVDAKIAKGEKLGKLAGIPFVINDNILCAGKKATCASKFLQNFESPYTATAVQRLLDEDAIIIARANMDEFAMGNSTENSAYGVCKNAQDDTKVAGGASGGVAVAVSCNMCTFALGTDTDGDARIPSAFNGVVGAKPTYGRVSRFGVAAFGSSYDQVSPITKNVADNAYVLQIIAGADLNDQTCLTVPVVEYMPNSQDINGKRVGICKQLNEKYKTSKNYEEFEKFVAFLQQHGASVKEIDMPEVEFALSAHYIISSAEATSNLGRYDGIKVTTRKETAQSIEDLYTESRTEGFGEEVQKRMMLGNFALSKGNYEEYFVKAKKVQQTVVKAFAKAFEECDVIITPVSFGEAFKIGEKRDAVELYNEDIFTAVANVAKVPAISVPYANGKCGLPIGLQIMAKELNEKEMYNFASYVEKSYKGGKNE